MASTIDKRFLKVTPDGKSIPAEGTASAKTCGCSKLGLFEEQQEGGSSWSWVSV